MYLGLCIVLNMPSIKARYETLIGEDLKCAAERALEIAGSNFFGRKALELYASNGMGRIHDPALYSEVCGIGFENPVIVGAGWDKKGRAIHGLYALGFGGVEVGTVTPVEQYGNEKPRLWTIDKKHRVGLNRLGFNSPGDAVVGDYLLAAQPLPCPIGLNVGRNKTTSNEMAAQAHARVISGLSKYASYIVLGISSPNTPDLRGLQDKGPLRELIQSAQEAMTVPKPLFVKIDSERSPQELSDMIEVGLEEGLSGADPNYRALSTATVRHIYQEAGDKLVIMGVGGVDSPAAALDKMRAGASLLQVVTAMRASRGKVASKINKGLLRQMERDGVTSITDYIGEDTRRGTKAT